MKLKIFPFLFIVVLSLSSCSSDSDSGDDVGTTTGDYYPLAADNKWRYTDNSNETEINVVGTTNFNGETYYEMTDTYSTLGNQSWMVKRGASYYQKVGVTNQMQGSTSVVIQPYEMKILRDDLAVNETWSGRVTPRVDYSGPNGSGNFKAVITYQGTMMAKNMTETLGGISYDNVIKVILAVNVDSNGQVNTIYSEYWFAKDIGLIYQYEASSLPIPTLTRYLISRELN